MRRNALLLAILVLVAVVGSGCGGGTEAPPPPPTKTPKPTFTLTPDWTPTPAVFPTATAVPATPTPEPTLTPTEPPSPTPVPIPRLTANQNVNIRTGPGTNYAKIGTISAGQSYDITGKNPAGNWLEFDYNGRTGWVLRDMVTVSGNAAGIEVAQNIPAPPIRPTPRPQPPPQPTSPPQPAPPPQPQYPFQLVKGVEHCESNPGQTYFDGYVRFRNNSPRNGVCVHVAYYGPRATKCSGCDGAGDGRWSFSPFGGPAPAGTTVEIFIVQCPSSMPAGGQGQQTGFGDLTPQSDKWVRTFSQSEECHGITFVGD